MYTYNTYHHNNIAYKISSALNFPLFMDFFLNEGWQYEFHAQPRTCWRAGLLFGKIGMFIMLYICMYIGLQAEFSGWKNGLGENVGRWQRIFILMIIDCGKWENRKKRKSHYIHIFYPRAYRNIRLINFFPKIYVYMYNSIVGAYIQVKGSRISVHWRRLNAEILYMGGENVNKN